MIIDYKKKYIFIGLPFSASSAISKELLEQYNGQPLLHKHSNIPILLKERPDIDLNEYFIFAVARDPVEIVFTFYNKLLTNAHGVYTNPKYFSENGGHVSKSGRSLYKKIKQHKWTFEDFIQHKYRFIPYDNYLSENKSFINHIIRFDHLLEDFAKCLSDIGIEAKRDLPLYNKTNKINGNGHRLSPELKLKVFGSFLSYNHDFFNGNSCSKLNFFQKNIFLLSRKIRSRKWLQIDNAQKDLNKSMID